MLPPFPALAPLAPTGGAWFLWKLIAIGGGCPAPT